MYSKLVDILNKCRELNDDLDNLKEDCRKHHLIDSDEERTEVVILTEKMNDIRSYLVFLSKKMEDRRTYLRNVIAFYDFGQYEQRKAP